MDTSAATLGRQQSRINNDTAMATNVQYSLPVAKHTLPPPPSHQGTTLTTDGINLVEDDDVKWAVDAKLLLIHLGLSKQVSKMYTALQ